MTSRWSTSLRIGVMAAALLGLMVVLQAILPTSADQRPKPAKKPQPTGQQTKKTALQKVLPPVEYKEKPKRFDQPDEAQAFYVLKRSPDGKSPIPVERYFTAAEHMKDMAQYSTALGKVLPSRRELETRGGLQPEILGAWTSLGPGNVGGRTRAILIDPNNPSTMYAAGAGGGVWKSVDGGASFTPLLDLLPNIAVCSMVMDPKNSNVIYAGTGEGVFNGDAVRGVGIFKTTNGGVSWNRLSATTTSDFFFVNHLVISPTDSNRLYAGTMTGVWRSLDGGNTWSQILNPKNSRGQTVFGGCLDLALRNDQATDVLLASCGTFEQASIYRNPDAGGNGDWTVAYTEAKMARTSLAIAPSNQNIVYAMSAMNDDQSLLAVFRSNDGGVTWTDRVRNTSSTKLNTLLLTNPLFAFLSECGFGGGNQLLHQGWYDNALAVDPVNPDIVWAGGIDLFRSDDGGANWGVASYWWSEKGKSHYAHADKHTIVFHPKYDGSSNKIMFHGCDGGIFRTDDARGSVVFGLPCDDTKGGVVFTPLNNNYAVTQFYHGLPYPDGKTYFGGAQDNGTVRGNDAAGPNLWSDVFGGDGGYVAINPVDTRVIYFETQNFGFRKSTDGGATSAPATSGIPGGDPFLFIPPFVMDPGNPQTLWAGSTRMYRTTNGAANWVAASAPLTSGNFPVSAIAVSPSDSNTVLVGRVSGFVHRITTGLTSDGSTPWPSVLPTNPTQAYCAGLAFDPKDTNVVYAVYASFGVPHVWKSTNGGLTWTNIDGSGNGRLPDIPVHCIAVDPTNTSRLFIGTDMGVFASVDGGNNWLVENTGFANVSTDSLTFNTVDGVTSLFAFTHGRGAWRVLVPGATVVISPLRDVVVKPGESASVQVTAVGPTGTAGLKFSLVTSPPFVTLADSGNGSATLNIAPKSTDTEGGLVTVKVTDPQGLTAQTSFNVTVRVVDDVSPMVTNVQLSKSKISLKKDRTLGITWTSKDNIGVDSHDILYAADGKSFNTLVVTGLPGNAQSYTWTLPALSKTKTGRVDVLAKDKAENVGEGMSGPLSVK